MQTNQREFNTKAKTHKLLETVGPEVALSGKLMSLAPLLARFKNLLGIAGAEIEQKLDNFLSSLLCSRRLQTKLS